MNLTPMRYKDFVWPHNPRTYSINYERKMGNHKLAYGNYRLQNLGLARRVMRGEGEFVGEGAYEQFKALACVFYDSGAGTLIHPAWQSTQAHFVELAVAQEPRADYVRYSFTFWEEALEPDAIVEWVEPESADDPSSTTTNATTSSAQYHTVKKGENLWVIGQSYGVTLATILSLNPQIRNPNLIYAGEQVRVR